MEGEAWPGEGRPLTRNELSRIGACKLARADFARFAKLIDPDRQFGTLNISVPVTRRNCRRAIEWGFLDRSDVTFLVNGLMYKDSFDRINRVADETDAQRRASSSRSRRVYMRAMKRFKAGRIGDELHDRIYRKHQKRMARIQSAQNLAMLMAWAEIYCEKGLR